MYSLTTLTLFPCKSVRYLFVAVSYCACVTSRHVNINQGVKLGTHTSVEHVANSSIRQFDSLGQFKRLLKTSLFGDWDRAAL